MTGPFLPVRVLITSADAVDDPDIFPLLIGQNFIGGKAPMWSTSVRTASSGRERRQPRWSYPKWSFKIAYEVLRDRSETPDLQKLWTFFNMHAGRAYEFGFLDPTDNTATDMPFATGDGATTDFQLTRTTTFGGITFTEPLFRVIGVPTFYADGVEVGATVGGGGMISFDTAPADAAVLTWTGQFAFWVRFDTDQLEAAQMVQSLWSQAGLPMISVKL